MEPICEEFGCLESSDDLGALGKRIALVGLVAIEWFVEDAGTELQRAGIELFESMAKPLLCGLFRDPWSGSALHRADDDGSS